MLIRIETPDINIIMCEGRITFQNLRNSQTIILDVELETITTRDGLKEIVRSTIYDLTINSETGIKSIMNEGIASIIVKLSSYDIKSGRTVKDHDKSPANYSVYRTGPSFKASPIWNSPKQNEEALPSKPIDVSNLSVSVASELLKQLKSADILQGFINKIKEENLALAAPDYLGMSDKMDRITLDRKINELIANGSIKEASEYHEYMLGFLKGLKFVGNDDNALDNKI